MSKLPTIFLSYNPNSEFEETLAVRLHTIGAVHGFRMLLPDRFSGFIGVNPETKNRILLSDYFILFSTSAKLSTTLKAEIKIAYKHLNNKKKILVIYDKHKGKNLINAENCTEIYVDSKNETIPEIIDKIFAEVKMNESKSQKVRPIVDDVRLDLFPIVLAGLSLLLLGALASGQSKRGK